MSSEDTMKKFMTFIKTLTDDQVGEMLKARKLDDCDDYDEIKQKIEKQYFKLYDPVCFGRQFPDHSRDTKFMSKSDAVTALENVHITITKKGKTSQIPFFTRWKQDPEIRAYERVVFAPPPCKAQKDEFNAYTKYIPEKHKKVPILEFKEHINSLCNYDEKCYKYVMSYLADIVQNAGSHTSSFGKCIVFKGAEGCGKSLLKTIMRKVLGAKYVDSESDINRIISGKNNRFADALAHKLLFFIEEAKQDDGYSNADRMKDTITNEEMKRELKGINGLQNIANFCRLIIVTNNNNVVKITSEDRRFVVIECSSKHTGLASKPFWANIVDLYNDPAYIYSIYQYLTNYDISGFNFNDRPVTEAYKAIQSREIPNVIRFIKHLCIDEPPDGFETKSFVSIRAAAMYSEYTTFMRTNGFKMEMSSTAFGIEMKTLNQKGAGITKRLSNGKIYHVDKQAFTDYCRSKKYDIFDDDCEEFDEQNDDPYEEGIEPFTSPKWQPKPPPITTLFKKNIFLMKQNKETKTEKPIKKVKKSNYSKKDDSFSQALGNFLQ